MLASIFDPLHRVLHHPQLWWILLWLGLAFLIVSLVVMICTSWGQSHPLRKCAGLSLLAHLLLVGYATTIQIVTATGNGHRGGGMNLLLVDGGVDGSDQGIDDPSAELITDPWNRPPAGELPDAAAESLNRDNARLAVLPRPREYSDTLPTSPPLLEVPLAHPAPPLLEVADVKPESKPAEPINEPSAAQSAHDIDPPPQPKPSVPDLPAESTTAKIAETVEKPSELLPPATPDTTLPQLPEQPVTSDIGEWVPGRASGGNLPSQPEAQSSPSGIDPPRTDQTTSSAAADHRSAPSSTAPNSASSTGNSTGPLVEAAAGPIASRGVPEIYSDRVSPERSEIGRRRGGSPEAESAVQAALRWLAINQSADGRWDADRFGAGKESAVLGQDRQGAGAKADTAVTGLALLAFLGAGNTHLQGDFAKNVQRGLEYLLSIQGRDGNLAGQAETFAFMYSHGMATLAVSEAFAMTGDKRLEPAVQSAINFTLSAQIRSSGGWRYRAVETPVERGDTSQLGWQLMALKSAELAGINIPGTAGEGAIKFIRSVSSGNNGGKASYRPGEAPSRTMTAEALVCRQFLGMARDNPASNEAGEYLLSQLPSPERINLYYWYYGTLGMYQLQGDYWQCWNEALQNTLVSRQRGDGDLAGSWDPDCLWAGYGGRVYSTAMSTLCLEVYYRYLPIYRIAGHRPATGANK